MTLGMKLIADVSNMGVNCNADYPFCYLIDIDDCFYLRTMPFSVRFICKEEKVNQRASSIYIDVRSFYNKQGKGYFIKKRIMKSRAHRNKRLYIYIYIVSIVMK
jgi:hypothetical protein